MAKKGKIAESRPLTKRQLSKWQRQRQVQRITIIAGSIFFLLIIGFVGFGYYNDEIRPYQQPVVRVNKTVFDMGYYIKMLGYLSRGGDEQTLNIMATMTPRVLEESEVIRQGAAGLGIAVSDAEIDALITNPEARKDQVYRDVMRVRLVRDKLYETYIDPKVPASAEQVHAQAIFLESEKAARQISDRLLAGESFSALTKEASVEPTTKQKEGDLGWLPKGYADVVLGSLAKSVLKDAVFSIKPGVVSAPIRDDSLTKKVGYWLLEVTQKDPNKGSNVRGILLGSRQEAEEIRARLKAGENFAVLVAQYSLDEGSKKSGGDLGWVQPGVGNQMVAEAVAKLDPGVLSEPVFDPTVVTKGGYWLVQIVEKDDNRKIDGDMKEKLRQKVFEDWYKGVSDKCVVETYLTEEQKIWAMTQLRKNKGT